MLIEIKNRRTGAVLFSCEAEDIKTALEKAVEADSNLVGANLFGANLVGANLFGANLVGANLVGARLEGARLDGANLVGANLVGANLVGANLFGARLDGANLVGARLVGANLFGANLVGARLVGANLFGARLDPIRDDFWAVLCSAPKEVSGLRLALVEGRVDGSTYNGPCACLVGTLQNVAKNIGDASKTCLIKNSIRPAEMFFLGIKKGDKPETCQQSKIALEWVDAWLVNMREAFGQPTA